MQSLIDDIGLLNADGMEMLYPIFKDAENAENPDYKDKFPSLPFPHKPRPPHSGREYKRRLEEVNMAHSTHSISCRVLMTDHSLASQESGIQTDAALQSAVSEYGRL